MADNESTNNNPDNNIKNSTSEEPLIQQNTTKISTKPKANMFAWKIGAVVLIGAIAFIYTTIDIEITQPHEITPIESIVLDERLQFCNKVMSGEPTEDFNTCLSAAKDGQILAVNRIIWAYARSGEYQNWQEVFTWLKALPYKDENTQLLMYAIIHFMASSKELKKDSEIGISRLVAKNYPPANILLASIYALEENVLPPTSNIQWLLERESNEEFNAITPIQLLLFYANGYVGNADIQKANDYLQQVTERNYPINANNIAWFLSTIDNNPFANQEYALSLARQITDDPEYAQNPIYIDTLAAALAANGMFDEAVEMQQKAIELLDESSISEKQKTTNRTDFESRLTLYSNGDVLIDETMLLDKTTFFSQLKARTIDILFRPFYTIVNVPAAISHDLTIESESAEVSIEEE